ncbi:hypothetical protein [Microbacterium sp. Yaish 1]|uniref:hypothetical protein n=1 Tax=Microbacterium sp. Yaish 1 TaxID=2025014 RepID=UPI000B9412C1|nr:hypothetical protein [Microbacterium sp. Yaish 1]OYC97941.1 hypothetical protein CI089_05305 [Microbacterium sp. Yaish 1]
MANGQTVFTAFGAADSVAEAVELLEQNIHEQLGDAAIESVSHSSFDSADAFVATAVVVARAS